MKVFFTWLWYGVFLFAGFLNSCRPAQQETFVFSDFEVRVVAKYLSNPWEVTYGPDNFLWVTEARGYRVLRINPLTGQKQVLADLNSEKNFLRYDLIPDDEDGGKPWPQGGLMGMALHPLLLKGKPYVYLTYIYKFEGAARKDNGKSGENGFRFLSRIVRYVYDLKGGKLIRPLVLCDTVPGSNDHTGGRLLIAEEAGMPYLFCTIGDMGAGQFGNAQRVNYAQDKNSYEGKVLRFNLEHDADANGTDQWIPNDNPFNGERQNAVWTLGHRNAQGLAAVQLAGKTHLYAAEHGPYSDDELNCIEGGCNYGHPLVIGYDDGNYNGLPAFFSNAAVYGTSSLPVVKDEKSNALGIGKSYRNPLKSFSVGNAAGLAVLAQKLRSQNNVQSGIVDKTGFWETYAPSSLDVYTADAIPGWKNSLLVTTLKGGRLLRVKLDPNGRMVDGKIHQYVKSDARYRDLAISPDGLKIYLALDSIGVTSEPSKFFTEGKHTKGCILELNYKR